MYCFLSLERLASEPLRHHHTEVCGQGGCAQPHSPPVEGSDPAQPGSHRSRVGRGAESPSSRSGNPFPGFSARDSQALARASARRLLETASHVTAWLVIALIRFYQVFISPLLPPSCRFVPTCSTYAYGAVQEWGPFRGGLYAMRRLLRCHPLGGRGYDPVPLKAAVGRRQ
jgi:uncharacterized protein